ncbi:MAG: hypothetical protein NVSMB51_06880 [Solirubrobacteraceae bacterium]
MRLFQRHHHLADDGRVGARTAAILRGRRAARAPRHTASAVKLLQRRLGLSADGVFGAGTLSRVRRFQSAHGLRSDGVVGGATWAALGVRGRHATLHSGGGVGVRSGQGSLPRRIRWATVAADRIAHRPYRYGGGHGSFRDSGYDCSGSVSYVLHAARALAAPLDSSQLESYGLPGHGRWITIYANGGHAFMTIGHHRFDTSGQSAGGSRWQARGRSGAGYVVRHPPGL